MTGTTFTGTTILRGSRNFQTWSHFPIGRRCGTFWRRKLNEAFVDELARVTGDLVPLSKSLGLRGARRNDQHEAEARELVDQLADFLTMIEN